MIKYSVEYVDSQVIYKPFRNNVAAIVLGCHNHVAPGEIEGISDLFKGELEAAEPERLPACSAQAGKQKEEYT